MNNLDASDHISSTSGSDTLNLTSSGIIDSDILVDNITGFETLNMSSGDDTVSFASQSDFSAFSSEFTTSINANGGDDTLSFGNTLINADLDFSHISGFENINLSSGDDSLIISGDESKNINGLGGDDTFSLDFSNIDNFNIDGGADTDTVKLSGSTSIIDNTEFANTNSFNDIETLDIRNITFASDDTQELVFTDELLESWTDSSNTLKLQLTADQANKIKFTGSDNLDSSTTITYDGDTAETSITNGHTYDLGNANLIIEIL